MISWSAGCKSGRKVLFDKRNASTKFALCRQLSCMRLLPEVASNSVLDTVNCMGKCNDDIKMLRQ